MLEIIILIVAIWLGYHAGVMHTSWRLRHYIIKAAKQEGIKIDNEYNIVNSATDKPDVFELTVEKANNILYLYEKNTDNFICQGSTLEELATLAQKYKNIKYAAVLNGDEVYAFVDGVVKTEKEMVK